MSYIWVTYELHIFVDSASWIISCAGAIRGSDSAGDIDLSLLVGEGSCAMSPRTSCAAASLFCITIWESRLILAYPCLSYFVLFYHGCQKRESPQGFLLTDPHATSLCQGFHRRTLSKQGRHTLNSQEVLPRERVDPICVWRRKSRTSPVFCWLSMARRTWSKVERCWTHILHIFCTSMELATCPSVHPWSH